MGIVHFKRKRFAAFFADVELTNEGCHAHRANYSFPSVLDGKIGERCPCCKNTGEFRRFRGVVIPSRGHELGTRTFYVCEAFLVATCDPECIPMLALSGLAYYGTSVRNGEFSAKFSRFELLQHSSDWDQDVLPDDKRRTFTCCSCREAIATVTVRIGEAGKRNPAQPFCAECVYKQDRLRKAIQVDAGDADPAWDSIKGVMAKFCQEAEKIWPRNFEPEPPKANTSHHYAVGAYRHAFEGQSADDVMEAIHQERLEYMNRSTTDRIFLTGVRPARFNPWTGKMLPERLPNTAGDRGAEPKHIGHRDVHLSPWGQKEETPESNE